MEAAAELTALLARTAMRDREAFAELYRRTSAKLLGIILRILRRRDLADDVLQEVYIKIWERAGDFDSSRASPMTWISAIARNRAIDEIRRKGMMAIDDLPLSFEVAGDNPDPLASRERGDQLRGLLACLQELDPQRRLMVLLAYYHGASREALSQRFETPVPTIKTWLHRSLAQLRQCLAA
jgi:RNA polymerase sigma-70 factor (ECF subfamily)